MIRVPSSPGEAIKSFRDPVDFIDMNIEANNGQMRILSHIRDSSLPKLMSGQTRVPVEAT